MSRAERNDDLQSSTPALTLAVAVPRGFHLPPHTPQPPHGLTSIHPPLSHLYTRTCPLHWQSHIIIFSGRDTACICLYCIFNYNRGKGGFNRRDQACCFDVVCSWCLHFLSLSFWYSKYCSKTLTVQHTT